jgi:hypothetical protein
MKLCSGKTKAGKPCRAAAGPGGLCFFHANPDRAKSLGQIGGLRNKKFTGVNLEVPDSITGSDLCRLEVQVVKGLLSGEIPAREATAIAQMFNLLHRHLPTADFERRIALLEESSVCVSIPIDAIERAVGENDPQVSPESSVRVSEKGSNEVSNIGNDTDRNDEEP